MILQQSVIAFRVGVFLVVCPLHFCFYNWNYYEYRNTTTFISVIASVEAIGTVEIPVLLSDWIYTGGLPTPYTH